MSHSRGKLCLARFCPWCATDNIERDTWKGDRHSRVEFVCRVCGVGWRLEESRRRQHVNMLMAEERKLRVPNGDIPPVKIETLCKKQYKVFRHAAMREMRYQVGLQMKEWLQTKEGKRCLITDRLTTN